MDLLSSRDDGLIMGQVPPVSFKEIGQPLFFSQQLRMQFSTFTLGRVEGMDLPSSGDVTLTRVLAGDLPLIKEHLP